MLFKEIIAVNTENHTKDINTKFRALLLVKSGGTCKYHWDLNG